MGTRAIERGKTGRATATRLAWQVRKLGLPVPFALDRFGSWLESRTGRESRLIAAIMEPGGPSGALIRKRDTDYLYYEEQTSAFHQAHIVLCLAARLLLAEGMGAPVDPPMVSGASPRLMRLMLGEPDGGTVTQAEAEAFAFLAMDRVSPAYSPVRALRAVRCLRPLHMALDGPVQILNTPALKGVQRSGRYRLHRQVTGIRDAALVLKPYRDPEAAAEAAAAGKAAGLVGGELAAAVEAAVLAAAMRAKAAGQPPSRGGYAGLLAMGGSDLRGEADWLVKVSRAFNRLRCWCKGGGWRCHLSGRTRAWTGTSRGSITNGWPPATTRIGPTARTFWPG